MKPILFPETATVFDTNGIGVLTDAISCRVVEELNGQFELSMTYPIKGLHAGELTDRQIILAKPDPAAEPQPFRIYRVEPVSRGTVTVSARHVAYDMQGIPIGPVKADSVADAMDAIPKAASVPCPFTLVTDKTTVSRMDTKYPRPLWKLLAGSEGSLLDVYGGEYEFDRWTVRLLKRRGMDRGVSIRYGKNLTTLEQDRNCAGCYTGVEPYWMSQDGELLRLPERVLYAEGTYSYTRIFTLDLSQEWQEKPTEAQLRARAKKYMKDNSIGVPAVSWKVEFVQLEQTEEYRGTAILEHVGLGDTVSVVFPAMGVSASARAVAIEYDVLLDRYISVTLGKVRSNLADAIVRQGQELAKRPVKAEVTGMISDRLSLAMGVHGGAVRLLDTNGDNYPDELYIANDPDPAKATRVWRWNYMGWAVSDKGFNGPFKMGATLEDGLLAEFVTAAHLRAGTITGQNFFMDLDNGIIRMSSKGKTTFSAGPDGLEITGKVTATSGEFHGTVYAESGEFKGKVVATSGEFHGAVYADKGEFKGKVIATSGEFTGKVTATSGSFTGKVVATSGSFTGKVVATSGEFHGDIYAENGYFNGSVQAKNIGYGGSDGYVSGSALSAGSVGTSRVSAGVNTSLGYADRSNDVFSGNDEVGYMKATWGMFRNLSVAGTVYEPMTYSFVDGKGNTIYIRCLGRSSVNDYGAAG